MELNQNIVTQAQNVLRACSAQLPPSLYGLERIVFLCREVLSKLPEQQRQTLRNLFDTYLEKMRQLEASDIDLGGPGANGQIWLRIHGNKRPALDFGLLTLEESDILILALISAQEREILLKNMNYDFSYVAKHADQKDHRFRATIYVELNHLALNMRAINTQIRPFQQYRFHQNVTKLLSLSHTKEGLTLITGITGSGKSTTLDSIVDMNNQLVNAHIVIIASPIEYVHKSKKCTIKHREVGADTTSFKNGAKESLRQDPDIIVIGEMRDAETIITALEVADSGHKVFSTLHTSSAVESIDRIIGEMPPLEQNRVQNRLSDILRCVISQKLVPSTDGRRVLAKEVLVMTPSVRAAIRNENIQEIYQMINEGKDYGMITLEQDLLQLYRARQITLETALNYANNKRRMKQLLHDKLLLRSM